MHRATKTRQACSDKYRTLPLWLYGAACTETFDNHDPPLIGSGLFLSDWSFHNPLCPNCDVLHNDRRRHIGISYPNRLLHKLLKKKAGYRPSSGHSEWSVAIVWCNIFYNPASRQYHMCFPPIGANSSTVGNTTTRVHKCLQIYPLIINFHLKLEVLLFQKYGHV